MLVPSSPRFMVPELHIPRWQRRSSGITSFSRFSHPCGKCNCTKVYRARGSGFLSKSSSKHQVLALLQCCSTGGEQLRSYGCFGVARSGFLCFVASTTCCMTNKEGQPPICRGNALYNYISLWFGKREAEELQTCCWGTDSATGIETPPFLQSRLGQVMSGIFSVCVFKALYLRKLEGRGVCLPK